MNQLCNTSPSTDVCAWRRKGLRRWGGSGVSSDICEHVHLLASTFHRLVSSFLGVKQGASQFLSLCLNTLANPLKGGKICFGSRFQKLQCTVSWLHCYSEAEHHGDRVWQAKARKQRGRGWDKIYPSKSPPKAHFLQLGPAFHFSTTSIQSISPAGHPGSHL